MTHAEPAESDRSLERLQREADQKKSEWPEAPEADADEDDAPSGDQAP